MAFSPLSPTFPTHWCRAIWLALVLAWPVPGLALDWGEGRYSIFSRGMKLQEVLEEIAANAGVSVNISEAVEGRVSLSFRELPLKEIFDRLIRTYHLVWYFDGEALHVSTMSDMESRLVKLKSLSPTLLVRRLRQMGMLSAGNPYVQWDLIEGKKMVRLAGPKGFLEQVEKMAVNLDARSGRTSIIYRWTDAQGRVHYSNQYDQAPEDVSILEFQRPPTDGAERGDRGKTSAEANLRTEVAVREGAASLEGLAN